MLTPITGFPEIDDDSTETILIDNSRLCITIAYRARGGSPASVTFTGYQGIRVTSEDFHVVMPKTMAKTLHEVSPSKWIHQLRARHILKFGWPNEFIDKSHHYILPFYCTVVEIAALEYTVET